MGQGATSGTDKSHYCANCEEAEENVQLQCCKMTLYCSTECQGTHWTSQKEQC